MKAIKQIELTPEEVQVIDSFFEVLTEIGRIASDKSAINICRYLMSNWAYRKKTVDDSTIYIDEIDEVD